MERLSDQALIDLYLNKNLGIRAIETLSGLAQSTVLYRLKNLGVHLSNKHIKSNTSRRSKHRWLKEFKGSTKKQRFTAENGLCQECHQQIGDGLNWRLATYHHIKSISQGGDRSPENCMVLHRTCHENPEIFFKLHGFKLKHVNFSPPGPNIYHGS